MPETTWDIQRLSDAGFSSSKPSEYIERKLMKPPMFFGDPAPFCVEGVLGEGSGDTIRWDRWRLLPAPRSTANSSQISTPLDLVMDQVEATLDTYEAVTRWSKRANFHLRHSVMQGAINLHRELFHRLGRLTIIDVLLSATNIYYGGGAASRSALTTSDNDAGTRVRKAIAGFRDVGAMGPDVGGHYPGFCHPDVIDILLDDTAFNQAESFQGKGMYEAKVKLWRDVMWYPTNLLPVMQLLASPTTASSATAGSLTASTTYYLVVTRVNPLTRHAEGISAIITRATAGGQTSIDVTLPAATYISQDSSLAHVYDIYIGTAAAVGSIYRVATSQAAAAVVNVGTLPGSGVTAPVAPASGVKVTPIILMAEEGCGCVTNELYRYGRFKATFVDGKPTLGNDTGRIQSAGINLDTKSAILNQKRLAQVELGYN